MRMVTDVNWDLYLILYMKTRIFLYAIEYVNGCIATINNYYLNFINGIVLIVFNMFLCNLILQKQNIEKLILEKSVF